VCGIATLKEREVSFRVAIASIYPQVDEITAVLNYYDAIPQWLTLMPKVRVRIGDNSLGDSGKFIGATDCDGYYFSIDDDLKYPPTYCQDMISKIDKYNCIVTLHGKRYDKRPIKSFKRGLTTNIHCLNALRTDTEVHLGGTGVMAFHTKDFRPKLSEFKKKNMADIWIGKQAKEQGVKIMAVEHPKSYLTYLNPVGTTIWRSNKDDIYQTSVLASFLK